jgi:LDH2 family malate/lactate/ureidoglycolate dehydrogenase
MKIKIADLEKIVQEVLLTEYSAEEARKIADVVLF